MDGKLCDQVIFILTDLGSNYNYAIPKSMDKFCLSKELHLKSWLVKLATCIKKQAHQWVRTCVVDLNGMSTTTHLNVLVLGSYNMLFGIDWLYLNRTNVDFMIMLLSTWMTMVNQEPCEVRIKKHHLE